MVSEDWEGMAVGPMYTLMDSWNSHQNQPGKLKEETVKKTMHTEVHYEREVKATCDWEQNSDWVVW